MRTLTAAISVWLLGMLSAASAAPGDEIYARPGQLVTAQGTRLNFYCMGRGSPTVVFDSGWGDWAPGMYSELLSENNCFAFEDSSSHLACSRATSC